MRYTLLDRVGTEPKLDEVYAVGQPMVDPFGRHVSYLRLSVTDRCDLRCTYCMPEKMSFLPKRELLSFEELDRLTTAFIHKGIRKLRITGGEPLVRKDILTLIYRLGRHLEAGRLEELTMTTNATQLEHYASELATAGIGRINISIDSLNKDKFKEITRGGDLDAVLRGIDAAQNAGLSVKLNTVALKHDNAAHLAEMIAWAHSKEMGFTIIEAMPMGEVEADRFDQYIPLSEIKISLDNTYTLISSAHRTAGPARYYDVAETGGRVGFITPLSHNFCESCNRIRVTCTGQLYMCLGQEDKVDLRKILRHYPDDINILHDAIDKAILHKPKGHDFKIDRPQVKASVPRHMSVTGG